MDKHAYIKCVGSVIQSMYKEAKYTTPEKRQNLHIYQDTTVQIGERTRTQNDPKRVEDTTR